MKTSCITSGPGLTFYIGCSFLLCGVFLLLALIWVQTVWHVDKVPVIILKKVSRRQLKHDKFLSMQELRQENVEYARGNEKLIF